MYQFCHEGTDVAYHLVHVVVHSTAAVTFAEWVAREEIEPFSLNPVCALLFIDLQRE